MERAPASTEPTSRADDPRIEVARQHVVEFVSDSGEGAQTAGQLFGTVSAKMGNGVWTVEIIPAEIEPPVRSRSGASGNRIRIASTPVTNMGDTADVVVAFNEQVLYSRIDVGALRPGTTVFLESCWADSPDERIRAAYAAAVEEFRELGYRIVEVPMAACCLEHVADARRGKNVWALGMLCTIFERDLGLVERELRAKLAKKGDAVVETNLTLLRSGVRWAERHVPFRVRVPVEHADGDRVVMNGNQAVALGIMASGIEVCSMYPITPATSVSHFLAAHFHEVGGILHQAEDEISAIGFALGASYSGKTAVTVTSGPGLALKTEFLGLAVMAELPLVFVVVQRGDPATGLPTRVEQGDLLSAIFGAPGDAPKIVIAPSNIEECFHFIVTARRLAETFRSPVLVLTDASLATAQQPFERPEAGRSWLAPPIDQSPWNAEVAPYAWNPQTGTSARPIPGQRGGEYVLTGLAHDERSRVAYESAINQRSMAMRSRKLATLQRSLKPPRVHGDDSGDLLVVGWGSTRGAIEEAVDRVRADGSTVGAVHLRVLSPMEPGLTKIFARFREVLAIEMNYSDELAPPMIDERNRRRAGITLLLRARTLVDIDCWTRVPGVPFSPATIEQVLREKLAGGGRS